MSNLSPSHLSQISVYPIKSVKGISLSSAWVEKQGLLFDRRYMLADSHGVMVTARAFSELVLVNANIASDGMWLSYQDKTPLKLSVSEFTFTEVTAKVWSDEFTAYATTEEANQWFSAILHKPVQLLYTGEISNRVRDKFGHSVSFADGYPLLLVSDASLKELNKRSPVQHSMNQFRPNLVVSSSEPFIEDSWKRIKIGEVEFEIRKPCQRCILTTVDAQTGSYKRHKEPLKTLSKFRACDKGEVYFGQNLVAINEGCVQVGDPIEVLETKEKEFYVDQSSDSLRLTCVEIEEVARDFYTYWFEPTRGVLPSYKPGQHLPVEIALDGEPYVRYYTLSSSPSRPGRYAISVKKVDGGRVSNYLANHLHVGEVLSADTPTGSFHLQEHLNHPLLLLSAGSGVTPMISMLRYLSDKKQLQDTVFFHQCSTIHDIPFRDEIDELHTRHPGLQIILSLSQAHDEWDGVKGRLSLSHLKHIPNLAERQTFVCGPKPFMNKAKNLLQKLGLPDSCYHEESFGQRVDNKLVEEKSVSISFNGKIFSGDNKTSVLQQVEKQGLYIANSCRAGLCGACIVNLESGEVEQENVPVLTEAERNEGKILACCSVPLTDIELSD